MNSPSAVQGLSLFGVVLFFTGTTEKTLIEVLTQSSNAQRQLIAKAYEKATGRVYTRIHFSDFQSVVSKVRRAKAVS